MPPGKVAGGCDCVMNAQRVDRPWLHWSRPWLWLVLALCAWIAGAEYRLQADHQVRLLALDLTSDLSALPPSMVAAAERLQSAGAFSGAPGLAGLTVGLSLLVPLLPFAFLTTRDPRWSSRRTLVLTLAALLANALLLSVVRPLVAVVSREPSWLVPAAIAAVLLCVLAAPRPWLLKLTGHRA